MYDAIVVGARCAGSPTAMLLARRGHRVLVVDRLFAALRDNPRDWDRLFGTFAGTVPADEYFAPDNLARILGSMPAAA